MTIVTYSAAAAFDRAADGTLVIACVHDCRSTGVALGARASWRGVMKARLPRPGQRTSPQMTSVRRCFSRATEMCLALRSNEPRMAVTSCGVYHCGGMLIE